MKEKLFQKKMFLKHKIKDINYDNYNDSENDIYQNYYFNFDKIF